jgi:hypothetical protein
LTRGSERTGEAPSHERRAARLRIIPPAAPPEAGRQGSYPPNLADKWLVSPLKGRPASGCPPRAKIEKREERRSVVRDQPSGVS